MYFEFDKKDAMASYLSFSYQTTENVLQELDVVVKNDYASLPFVVLFQKAKSLVKTINEQQQVSLPTQVLKSPKFVTT
jgi:hypothetical protein